MSSMASREGIPRGSSTWLTQTVLHFRSPRDRDESEARRAARVLETGSRPNGGPENEGRGPSRASVRVV